MPVRTKSVGSTFGSIIKDNAKRLRVEREDGKKYDIKLGVGFTEVRAEVWSDLENYEDYLICSIYEIEVL